MNSSFTRFTAVLLVFFFILGCSSSPEPLGSVHIQRIDSLLGQGIQSFQKSDYHQAEIFFSQAQAMSISIDDPSRIILSTVNLAEVHILTGKSARALKELEYARLVAKMERNSRYSGRIHIVQARYYESLDKFTKAKKEYTKALTISESKTERAVAYNILGRLHMRTKEYEKAENVLFEARDINSDLEDHYHLADNEYNLGNLYYKQKMYTKALPYFLSALKNDRKAENTSGILQDLIRIAQVYERLDKKAHARNYYLRARSLAQKSDVSKLTLINVKIEKLK